MELAWGKFDPPPLQPLWSIVDQLSLDLLTWISEKHLYYLDAKFHEIDVLTSYLAGCEAVAPERQEFIEFVDGWTREIDPNLEQYLQDYSQRYHSVRWNVENQCSQIMADHSIWQSQHSLIEFWRSFAYINEVDSLHGMFLTSGRWYVNVMLPAIKELIYCLLPYGLSGTKRDDVAYQLARRLITPNFATLSIDYDVQLERDCSRQLVPILRYYDKKLLFLFSASADNISSLGELVADVKQEPEKYHDLLEAGVFPPFAWHELKTTDVHRTKRNDQVDEFEGIYERLMQQIPKELHFRAQQALMLLHVLKKYELNYNNYNYKGKFGLVSKSFYLKTASLMRRGEQEHFLNSILGDRFFEALGVVEAMP